MPHDRQGVFIALREKTDSDLTLVRQPVGQVPRLPIDLGRQGRFGQPWPDVLGDLQAGDRALKLSLIPIGEADCRHQCFSLLRPFD